MSSFFSCLSRGVELVQKQSKSQTPELYSVLCDGLDGPTTNCLDLYNWSAKFRTTGGGVKIESDGCGTGWGAVTSATIGTGNSNLPWPPTNATWDIGLEDAIDILNNATSFQTFISCIIGKPQHPSHGEPQPTYTFKMSDGTQKNVGGVDKQVWS